MNFLEELNMRGKGDLLEIPKFVSPSFSTENEVISKIEKHIRLNNLIMVYRDYDVDGASCGELFREMFEILGYTNYRVIKYNQRTHQVDPAAVVEASSSGCSLMIICDAGSSSPHITHRLNAVGVDTIILDHHESIFSYHDFKGSMINTVFENRITTEQTYTLSAGALCYLIVDKVLRRFGHTDNSHLSTIALASLYADSIDMSSELNRSIYYQSIKTERHKVPKHIQHFFKEYSSFGRRFIEYHYAPRINSLIRAERFDLLNKYLDGEGGATAVANLVDQIEYVYVKSREMVSYAADIIEVETLGNFVVAKLNTCLKYMKPKFDPLNFNPENFFNYTGLVANRLAGMYGKTAIVYSDTGNEIKGSLRDHLGRNYLEVFQSFCEAQGHPSAFGLHLHYYDLDKFFTYLKLVDRQFSLQAIGEQPIVVKMLQDNPNEEDLMLMAQYNEFAGVKSPVAYALRKWPRVEHRKDRYDRYKYKWGKFQINSGSLIQYNTFVRVKPYFFKGLKLEVVERV